MKISLSCVVLLGVTALVQSNPQPLFSLLSGGGGGLLGGLSGGGSSGSSSQTVQVSSVSGGGSSGGLLGGLTGGLLGGISGGGSSGSLVGGSSGTNQVSTGTIGGGLIGGLIGTAGSIIGGVAGTVIGLAGALVQGAAACIQSVLTIALSVLTSCVLYKSSFDKTCVTYEKEIQNVKQEARWPEYNPNFNYMQQLNEQAITEKAFTEGLNNFFFRCKGIKKIIEEKPELEGFFKPCLVYALDCFTKDSISIPKINGFIYSIRQIDLNQMLRNLHSTSAIQGNFCKDLHSKCQIEYSSKVFLDVILERFSTCYSTVSKDQRSFVAMMSLLNSLLHFMGSFESSVINFTQNIVDSMTVQLVTVCHQTTTTSTQIRQEQSGSSYQTGYIPSGNVVYSQGGSSGGQSIGSQQPISGGSSGGYSQSIGSQGGSYEQSISGGTSGGYSQYSSGGSSGSYSQSLGSQSGGYEQYAMGGGGQGGSQGVYYQQIN
ncbi:hypothetical protein ACFFRR_006329 [Megaselia abdita]